MVISIYSCQDERWSVSRAATHKSETSWWKIMKKKVSEKKGKRQQATLPEIFFMLDRSEFTVFLSHFHTCKGIFWESDEEFPHICVFTHAVESPEGWWVEQTQPALLPSDAIGCLCFLLLSSNPRLQCMCEQDFIHSPLLLLSIRPLLIKDWAAMALGRVSVFHTTHSCSAWGIWGSS